MPDNTLKTAIVATKAAINEIQDATLALESLGYTRALVILDNLYVASKALDRSKDLIIAEYHGG
jgi:hypothetical protein